MSMFYVHFIALYIKMYTIITMTKKEKIVKKFNSLQYNHLWLKYFFDYGFAFLVSVLSAAIFAFGVCAFLDPIALDAPLVSGGSSGLAQVVKLIFALCRADANIVKNVFSVAYILINVPIIILAFKGIGKRFGLFTLVNVASVSIFTLVFKELPFFAELATAVSKDAGMLARALFAGLCTGISSALAFKIESSAGGFDVVGYYLSLKKNNNTGPYLAIINIIIFGTFTVLNSFYTDSWAVAFEGLLYSIVYMVAVVIIVDLINVRNKKAQVEIVTNNKELPNLLMAYIPHGATLFEGKGVYSGKDHLVIHMVVSINEVKKVLKIVKDIDPESFVNVVALQQVYGRFHMKTVK